MEAGLQVLYDCPDCRIEGALVEVIVSGSSSGRCRMCSHETSDGVAVRAGRRFGDAHQVRAALAEWATDDGEVEVEQFVRANFTGHDISGVVRLVLAGERVETGFDVVAWLFRDRSTGQVAVGSSGSAPSQAGGGGAELAPSPAMAGPETKVVATERSLPAAPEPSVDPRQLAITRALCAVVLADGLIEPVERVALAAALAKLGAPEPTDSDWRLWRPSDLACPTHPERVIDAMRRVALSNQLPDPSESRVIREFARSWQVKLGDEVLPPVRFVQKFVKSWEGWFGR